MALPASVEPIVALLSLLIMCIPGIYWIHKRISAPSPKRQYPLLPFHHQSFSSAGSAVHSSITRPYLAEFPGDNHRIGRNDVNLNRLRCASMPELSFASQVSDHYFELIARGRQY